MRGIIPQPRVRDEPVAGRFSQEICVTGFQSFAVSPGNLPPFTILENGTTIYRSPEQTSIRFDTLEVFVDPPINVPGLGIFGLSKNQDFAVFNFPTGPINFTLAAGSSVYLFDLELTLKQNDFVSAGYFNGDPATKNVGFRMHGWQWSDLVGGVD